MNGSRFLAVVEEIRTSLWFLPTVSVVVSLVLALVLTRVEVASDAALYGLLFSGSADGARGMLQVVAGSVITVTSLTFSLTVVTLQLASSQFSPRLLRTFLRDRGNQIVLAVFLSTFSYALTVLRTIRAGSGDSPEFVPQLAVTVAFLLALASVAALVYFIDHITTEIRVDTMMRDVEQDTLHVLDRQHPPDDKPLEADGDPLPRRRGRPVPLPARHSGFLTALSTESLVRIAVKHDVLLELDPQVGELVIAGTPIAWVWPADGGGDLPRIDPEKLADHVAGAATVGFERTMQQDVNFGLRQLVDIAVKALSPGVNDPTTAVHALGHLAVLLRRMSERRLGPLVAPDDDGVARLVVHRPDLPTLLEGVCGEIRRYGAAEPAVMTALLDLLRDVAAGSDDERRCAAVRDEIDKVERSARRAVEEPADLVPILGAAASARAAADGERGPRLGRNGAAAG